MYIDAMVLRDRDSDANGTLDERVWPLFDANFNVSSIVDDEGAVLERYRYEPYGDRVVLNADFTPDTLAGSDSTTADDTEAGWNTSDVLFRHGHQGGAYDRVASEKMLFRFRTLDTQQMRWGQVDPLRYVDGMNAYQSHRSSPMNLLDPLGLFGIVGGSVVLPLIEAEKARRAVDTWNKDSPNWSWSNQCSEQAANQINHLIRNLPMEYWLPIPDGGSTLLTNHNVIKLLPINNNPLPPMVIDGFKKFYTMHQDHYPEVDWKNPEATLTTLDAFRREYPYTATVPTHMFRWLVRAASRINGWGPPLGGQGAHNGGHNIQP